MLQCEDMVFGDGQEYVEWYIVLWYVFEVVQFGDVLVIQVYGSCFFGCIGDILVCYFVCKGGVGIVVDGCICDVGCICEFGILVWLMGMILYYVLQLELVLWVYDVFVVVGGVLCMLGDFVVVDDDGFVVVLQVMVLQVVDDVCDYEEWEVFSCQCFDEGVWLSDYYLLIFDSCEEYEVWCFVQSFVC